MPVPAIEKRAKQEALHRLISRERALAREEGRNEARAEIVAELTELRDELTGTQGWSTKKATWTMAILVAQGKLSNKRRKQVSLEEGDIGSGSSDESAGAVGV